MEVEDMKAKEATDIDVEKIVSDVGGCGQFQIIVASAILAVNVLGSWNMFMMTFGTYNPGWTCENHTGPMNITAAPDQTHNGTSQVTSLAPSSSKEDMCELAKSCPRIVFDPETSTIVTEWSLICDRAWIASMIISIQMVGTAIGTVVTGYVGDRFGRKITFYAVIAMNGVMHTVAVVVVSWEMFAVVRFIIGLSAGGYLSLGSLYHQEFVTAKWRIYLTSLPLFPFGIAMFSGVVWVLKDWRNIHLATTVLAGLIFLTVFWVPESIRWLVVHRKTHQANRVVRHMCKTNRRPCPPEHLINFTKSEGSKMEIKSNVFLLFKRAVIKTTIMSVCLLFSHSFMYYAIGFGIKSLFGNFYINMLCFAITRIPIAFTVPYMANRLGRRWTALLFLIVGAGASFAVIIVFFTMTGDSRGTVITVLALLSSIGVGASWDVFVAHMAELFPTSVRSMGFSSAYTGARLGGILAPFCIPQSPDLLYIPYLIMGLLAAASGAMVMSLPETKGKGLEDTIVSERHALDVDVSDKVDADASNRLTTEQLEL